MLFTIFNTSHVVRISPFTLIYLLWRFFLHFVKYYVSLPYCSTVICTHSQIMNRESYIPSFAITMGGHHITDLVDSSPGMVRSVVHSEGWHNIGSEDCDIRVRLLSVKHCQHPPRLQKFIASQCLVAPHRLLRVHTYTIGSNQVSNTKLQY